MESNTEHTREDERIINWCAWYPCIDDCKKCLLNVLYNDKEDNYRDEDGGYRSL